MRFRAESPVEYFRELVESAIERQGVDVRDLTAFYLVNLLCGFVAPSGSMRPSDDRPLALKLGQALEAGGLEQRALLRQLGDVSLFTSGYFSDSLRRKLVDVDYYVSLGGYAYGSLSRQEANAFAAVFGELSQKFVACVDILAEVSERSGLATNADLLRVYEKWLRTGSRREGQRLVERGIVPNMSIGSHFLQ